MSSETGQIKTKTITVTLITCTHCGHEWQPLFNKLPKGCPQCKSKNYLKPRERRAHTKNRK